MPYDKEKTLSKCLIIASMIIDNTVKKKQFFFVRTENNCGVNILFFK